MSRPTHRLDKVLVRFGMRDLIEQELHRVDRIHRMKHLAEDPEPVDDFLRNEHFFLTCRGLIDIQARENTLFHQLAIQVNFGITGTLKLLENDLVHPGARLNERRSDDGKRAALLDVARRTKKALRLMESVGVDTAGEDLTGR